jgi:hypothetical protein
VEQEVVRLFEHGDNYALHHKVGGGGGHALIIEQFKVTINKKVG